MWKRKLRKFHDKYPFIESIFLFILGNAIGFFCNIFASDISTHLKSNGWRWIDSRFVWINLLLLSIGIIYYSFFSSYAISKAIESQRSAEDKLKLALVTEGIKKIKSPNIEYETKIELFELTIKKIRGQNL